MCYTNVTYLVKSHYRKEVIKMSKKIFFINGFGGGREDSLELRDSLEEKGYEFTYLDLPGQFGAKDVTIDDFEELLAYFEGYFPDEEIILMGHSIGAEIAAYLSTRLTQIERVIMLDGGILTNEDVGKTLAESMEETKEVLSQIGGDELSEEGLLELMKLNDEMKLTIIRPDYKTPTLLLLSDSEEELPIKMQRLEERQNPYVDYKVIQKASHNLYADQPDLTVKLIAEWLANARI